MAALVSQLRDFHAGLDPARRRVLWMAAVAAVVAVIGVGVWASAPSYVVLTRASDADEAAAVTGALAEAGLPYRVDPDGLTVRVPTLSEVDARRAAAGDGGVVGLEGLEKIDPWVTPFQEQLHRQRMLQGELVRTIEGIAGIRSATVQLDLPEPSAFLRDVTHPTAAVTLRPDEGGILDARTARSVAELVSHAVSGMGAEDVTVVDASSGRTLWGAAPDADGAIAVDAAHREAALAASVRAALAQLLGRTDAAAVTVRVELESAAVQETVNAVDPTSAVAATERIESEVDTRGSATAGGVPGTDANLAERATTADSGGRTRETQQTSYQFTTTTRTTTTPAGDIRRLSASVIIDSAVLGTAGATAEDAALREQIQRAVRAALGASDTRGDEVVVSFLPFVTASAAAAPLPAAAPAASSSETMLGALVLLGIAALVAKPLLRVLRPAPPAAPAETAPEAPAVEAPVVGEPPPAPLDFDARLRGHLDRLETHQPRDVSDLVRRESEHSAEVVRRWLQSS